MGEETSGCQLQDLFHLFGAPHVLDVLHVALARAGPVRFKEIQSALDISPNTLAERLKLLVEVGLLTRQAFSEIPPRVEYTASSKARDLWPAFETLDGWSKRHDLSAAPTQLAVRA